MIDFSNTQITQISIHYVGAKSLEEDIFLTETPSYIQNETIHALTLNYCLSGFKVPEFYCFKEVVKIESSTREFAVKAFENPEAIHDLSKVLARNLYNISDHPSIKSGELLVVSFKDLVVEDELLDGVGIFKCETKDDFLKFVRGDQKYIIDSDIGVALGKLDKACLILNTDPKSGYKVCVFDKGSQQANYWMDNFLELEKCNDEYRYTTHYMNLTKDFVDDHLRPRHNLDKREELKIMNASQEYFESNEQFDESSYIENLFDDPSMANEFKNYKSEATVGGGMEIANAFDISENAFKRNSKVYKSVLKLDKNFHVYIHGNRNLIERGVDEQGRKFYKLYYEEEH